jgi:hypothetical protein
MQRLTLSSVKSMVAKVLNLCGADTSRINDYINRACQRLLEEGTWVGTTTRYRVCAENGCIVWPRQLETILAFAICRTPLPIQGIWFEFLGNGTYLQDDASCSSGWGCGGSLIDRDEVGSFSNVIGTGKQLAVYCDVAEAAGAKILLQFYDANGQWVRTQNSDGDWIDGEEITFANAGNYALSSKFVMANGFIRAIKPITNGTVRIYEYDPVGLTYRPLAYYEPDETIPVYRRSLVPGLSISTSDACQKRSVTVIAKHRFIPVANDNDFLPISQPEAIRLAVQSIWKSENNMPGEAALYMYGGIDALTGARIEGAVPVLQKQLRSYKGHGEIQPIKMVNASTFGAGGIGVLV